MLHKKASKDIRKSVKIIAKTPIKQAVIKLTTFLCLMRAFLVKKRFITFAIESFHLFKLNSSLIKKTAPFMVIEKTK